MNNNGEASLLSAAHIKEDSSLLASGLKTLAVEKEALTILEKAFAEEPLSQSFALAIKLVLGSKGRVVVTGVGKSGHIGTKIAATLASTGTPALFVHAAEANHGDLGMINNQDVILALSWSGETTELKGILNHAARFSIPLIALTSGAQTPLGRSANVLLLLPKVKEACPHGLAPTSSSTLQLVMGDALAIALLEARGFTSKDFKLFHPGGSLGASLTYIKDVMHKGDSLPLVLENTTVVAAMKVLSQKHFGCVAVIDQEGFLKGIMTEGDLSRNIHRDLGSLTVNDIMTKEPKTISPDTLVGAATALIQKHRISALLVVAEQKPVGIVHFHDLLRLGAV